MSSTGRFPSDDELKAWVDDGLSVEQIADRIHERTGTKLAPKAVKAFLSRAGANDEIRWKDHIPWSPIRPEHANGYPAVMLRYAARREHGLEMSDDANQRLDVWLAKLRENDVVVTYDYDSEDGFSYVRPRPGIDTGLFRDPRVSPS